MQLKAVKISVYTVLTPDDVLHAFGWLCSLYMHNVYMHITRLQCGARYTTLMFNHEGILSSTVVLLKSDTLVLTIVHTTKSQIKH